MAPSIVEISHQAGMTAANNRQREAARLVDLNAFQGSNVQTSEPPQKFKIIEAITAAD
jgi:hypothetical protein